MTASTNSWDDETGEFYATLGNSQGELTRRPHSDDPWEVDSSGQIHRWTDGQWDWAIHTSELELTPEGLEQLKRQLSTRAVLLT